MSSRTAKSKPIPIPCAMASKIGVCQNTSCTNQGSAILVHDIEELVHGACAVKAIGCLGKCGMGPNVELKIDGIPEIVTGINQFKRVVDLVQEQAHVSIDGDVAKFARAKYDARREEDSTRRLEMIKACVDIIGGDEEAASSQPQQLAELLVMRSKALQESDPRRALEEARRAVKLAPEWAEAQVTVALACEVGGYPSEGLAAARIAAASRTCISKAQVKRVISRLEPQAKEEQENPERFSKKRGTKSTIAPVIQAAPKQYSSNIYSRFGGRPKFQALAEAVHEEMFVNPLTSDFFPPTMDNSRITNRNVDFLVGAFGGPKYKGPNMIDTHEFLRITDAQYDVMLQCYRNAIANMKIHEQFSQPIMRQLDGMRTSIVFQPKRPKPLARTLQGHWENQQREMKKAEKEKRKDTAGAKSKKQPQNLMPPVSQPLHPASPTESNQSPTKKPPVSQKSKIASSPAETDTVAAQVGAKYSETSKQFEDVVKASADADETASAEVASTAYASFEASFSTAGGKAPEGGTPSSVAGSCPFVAILGIPSKDLVLPDGHPPVNVSPWEQPEVAPDEIPRSGSVGLLSPKRYVAI